MKRIKPISIDTTESTETSFVPFKKKSSTDPDWNYKMKPDLSPNLALADPADRLMNYADTEHTYESVSPIYSSGTNIHSHRNKKEHDIQLEQNTDKSKYTDWLTKQDDKMVKLFKSGYNTIFK
jgi:hypothetical protein